MRTLWARRFGWAVWSAVVLGFASFSQAKPATPPVSEDPVRSQVHFDQRLNELIPLDVRFNDEAGEKVELGTYFRDRPVLLTLVYYSCSAACTQVLSDLVDTLKEVSLEPGKDFEVVVISIDPRETPGLAEAKKRTYLQRYGRAETSAGWHFLTGEAPAIKRVADAVGYSFVYVPSTDLYVHPAGVMSVTAKGKLARYFYGVEYDARDVRLGLVETAEGKIGTALDRFLLVVCHYDVGTGKYSVAVMRVIQLGGVATVLFLVILVGGLLWRERRRNRGRVPGAADLAGVAHQR